MTDALDMLPDRPRKGRGAVSNQSGRYEALQRVAVDDGWSEQERERQEPLRTLVHEDRSRGIIAKNESPDVPFNRSINPYRGCEHGCVYCFARPSHAWLGLSPGLDFESRIFAKSDAALLLREALAKPGYRPEIINLGAVTDPYQPIERERRITRQILEVMAEAKHPFTMVTKSNLVLRDLDILAPLGQQRLVRVMISVTTLDRGLARKLEPRAPTPARRLEAVRGLADAGVPCGVLMAPIIPAINDIEIEDLLARVKSVGARSAGYVLLRLPLEIKDLFIEWLEAHYPDRKEKVLKIVRETRGGKLYVARFGERQRGRGPYAAMLNQRFELASKRLGLNLDDWELETRLFRRPEANPDQFSLF